ncbi:MAG: enoyl-CoA hydratase [Promethearchaeota archaeon]
MTPQILTKIENKVIHIILNRPEKKNALSNAMYAAFANALEQGEKNEDVRVILIYNNGDCFCAGNDLKDFQDLDHFNSSKEQPTAWFTRILMNAEKPIIGAIKGHAIGVGSTMLLHFDLLYATPDTKFQFPFTKLGLVPEFGSSFNLPELVGKFRAAELLFFGEFFSGEEAHDIGLVNKLFAKEELIEKVTMIAEQLAERPPIALMSTKKLIKKYHKSILEKLMPEEGSEFVRRQVSPEAQEAFKAFFEKRKPNFSKFK